jgi:uncharacterized membrane protein YccF (DUF307 family)
MRTLLNVLWFVLSGLWLAMLVLCLTIVGIPLGLGQQGAIAF